jgi:hypothetical protein
MIETPVRPASPDGASDGRTSTAGGTGSLLRSSAGRRRPGGRLWVLLNAQALLRGATTDGIGIEDDRGRMAGRRAR